MRPFGHVIFGFTPSKGAGFAVLVGLGPVGSTVGEFREDGAVFQGIKAVFGVARVTADPDVTGGAARDTVGRLSRLTPHERVFV